MASNDGFLGALDALDGDSWSAVGESPAGHVTMRLLAHHAIWDSWIHERDIALPLGMHPVEEPDEIASCLRYAVAVGPTLALGQPDTFTGRLGVVAHDPAIVLTVDIGDSVSVRDVPPAPGAPCLRGPAVELIEALSVRAPMPPDAPADWRRAASALAAVFNAPI